VGSNLGETQRLPVRAGNKQENALVELEDKRARCTITYAKKLASWVNHYSNCGIWIDQSAKSKHSNVSLAKPVNVLKSFGNAKTYQSVFGQAKTY
jgi:hypothetical protein